VIYPKNLSQADRLVGIGRQTTECNYMFATAWKYNCLAAI
jgi:hypothetical protein